MISVSADFDLGADKSRMRDLADVSRQQRTVQQLLARLYARPAKASKSVQLLADEVGMGKTFVALGVAYSLLAAMQSGEAHDDLRGCTQKVLVIAPSRTLANKWKTEVSEFVKRCVSEDKRRAGKADQWFRAKECEYLDDLALAMRQTGHRVLITTTSAFGRKLRDQDTKKRFALAALCRYWGNGLRYDARDLMLKGAPDGWPKRADALEEFSEEELARLVCPDFRVAVEAVAWIAREHANLVEGCHAHCRDLGTPFRHNRADDFVALERDLLDVYRWMAAWKLQTASAFPLVIVDEAHHWRGGPENGTNGYGYFRDWIAPGTRRALLLTATPFQLRPSELLELIKIGQPLAAAPLVADSRARREQLEAHVRSPLEQVISNAERHSRAFARAWSRFPASASRGLAEAWTSQGLRSARDELLRIAHLPGLVDTKATLNLIESAVEGANPDVRELLREALWLFTTNQDLSQELGEFVIRHRRTTNHRLVRVGRELDDSIEALRGRQDANQLHGAPGLDVRGTGELPHYLLMRCLAEANRLDGREHHRTSLGANLTGCYSTLLESAEGRRVNRQLGATERGGVYLGLLKKMVSVKNDPEHPKLKAVVDRVAELWCRGEKALIFCFRYNTAERIETILSERIGEILAHYRSRRLGGGAKLERLLDRLRRVDDDLIMLSLDRVLWSFSWANPDAQADVGVEELALAKDDTSELARLFVRFGVDAQSADRVFLLRATEHVIAQRLLKRASRKSLWRPLLEAVADPKWIEYAYGTDADASSEEASEKTDPVHISERGVHQRYKPREKAESSDLAAVTTALAARRERAGERGVLEGYALAASLWQGVAPLEAAKDVGRIAELLRKLHAYLWRLSVDESGKFDFGSRAIVFQSLRRAMFREAMLVRLLPDGDHEEGKWGELLVERFLEPGALIGQTESMLDRIVVFLEDLQATSGQASDAGSARGAKLDATRRRNRSAVALVTGKTKEDARQRAFDGFNSPLLPEVLVCTQVGAEGIDLHRYCRFVVHYDLPWNPAIIEQRTGRVDRIGSKTFRERERDHESLLDIAVPFLAGTYDERIFEEVRVRAQTFEVLTGGTVSAEATTTSVPTRTGSSNGSGGAAKDAALDSILTNAEGDDAGEELAENEPFDGSGTRAAFETGLAVLPQSMIDDLRVRWGLC